jgi:pyridinium-3,5-bisthiocarboxylic acid mononucleotide nickel chelatase
MKILYYDCFSGISGDMNLGAMIDLGVDEKFLLNELEKLKLNGWKLIVEKDQRHGIGGTKVTIKQTRHEHHHRHLSDIDKIIRSSALDEAVKELSMKIFMKIAVAEASVHGISVEKVHFHEVGAIDSLIDIVGAAICFNSLKVDEVHVSVVELGGGMVKCDHGKLPVPAPATAEIIRNIRSKKGGVDFEATTPTGAAILAALGNVYDSSVQFSILKTAYGIGHKDHPEVPNLLRVFLGETAVSNEPGHEAVLLECNIDDMNPEFYEHVSEKLFNAGASDVFLTSIIMKKGRPGIVLSVICEKEKTDKLKEIIFTESTTLGIRTIPFRKDTLQRSFETVDTSLGKVTFKRSFYKGIEVSCKPESDDCRRIATESGMPVKEVFARLVSEAGNLKKNIND